MIGTSVILLSQDGLESEGPETKFQMITSYSQFEKVIIQKSIAEQVFSLKWLCISFPIRGLIKLFSYSKPTNRLVSTKACKSVQSIFFTHY